ncbi:hypothetical protein CC78DRAFT_532845 [Lojkania enalia]|uniref:DUF7053 domain-containing protein n=1 Tax=Lojkania enalia TaxID=147567 RepID=A0A9P4N8I6_9PLEO|nr:hypothetical protein CC78DRAFT_532845 [Didymosphaeria enalia]
MTAKHNLHVAALIPPHLNPEDVIAALHDHNTCLSLQALTTGHEKLPETNPETKKDTYWYPVDLHPVHTYSVTECVTVLPGIGEWGKKYINFPSCFQDTPHGIKTRADAPGGVTLRAEFRVIKGGADDGEVEGEGEGIGYAEWVLVEDVEVQCAWWMMPFVRKSMEGAHRDICKKVVEKVEMLKRQEQVAQTAAKGKGKADPEEQSPISAKDEERLPDKITYG